MDPLKHACTQREGREAHACPEICLKIMRSNKIEQIKNIHEIDTR